MVNVPMNSTAPFTKQTVLSINQLRVQGPKTSQNIQMSINSPQTVSAHAPSYRAQAASPAASSRAQAVSPAPSSRAQAVSPAPSSRPQVAASPAPSSRAQAVSPSTFSGAQSADYKPVPRLVHPVRKGQKVPLESSGKLSRIKACLGWNAHNASCDVDVSAFLLGSNGKVIGDSWFVFYGQTQSPDNSTVFSVDQKEDREIIFIDFGKLNPSVTKIVFVLTINEALEKHLNFSMLKDAYIRIVDCASNRELISFQMDEYYANVTSMMIGEVYQHNGAWKFHAIGNGVAKDLAGLCELYGVEVIS